MWLDHGQVRLAGQTADVVRAYLDAVDQELVDDAAAPTGWRAMRAEAVSLTEVGVHGASGEPCYGVRVRRADARAAALPGESGRASRAVQRDGARRLRAAVHRDVAAVSCLAERAATSWIASSSSLPLLPGSVSGRGAGAGTPATAAWALPQTVAAFRVGTDLSAFGSHSVVGATKSRGGFLAVAYDWRVHTSAGEQAAGWPASADYHRAIPTPVKDGARVVVVMPAYNAARTLEATYRGLAMDVVDEVILVDDVSHDETVDIAERLGLKVVVHVQNRGYGGNQKTCYLEALRSGADVVVMVHPDNQYDSTLVPEMIRPILDGKADIVLGSRFLSGTALSGGMPIWKFVSNRFLTIVENVAFGLHLSEYHTGFRAYSRRLLETLPFLLNSDDFVFDQQIMAQAVCWNFRIRETPVPTRYFAEASSVNFQRSVEYGLAVLWLVLGTFCTGRT